MKSDCVNSALSRGPPRCPAGQVVKTCARSPALTPAWLLGVPVVGVSRLKCSPPRCPGPLPSWLRRPSVSCCLWDAPLPSAVVCPLMCLVLGHVPSPWAPVLCSGGGRLPLGKLGEKTLPPRPPSSLPGLGVQRQEMRGRWPMAAFPCCRPSLVWSTNACVGASSLHTPPSSAGPLKMQGMDSSLSAFLF